MATDRDAPTPAEQVGRLYEQTEAEAAKATEHLVGSGGFASLDGSSSERFGKEWAMDAVEIVRLSSPDCAAPRRVTCT